MAADRRCRRCGGSLEGAHPNARYCLRCRFAGHVERARERYAERKLEGTAYRYPTYAPEQKARYAERRRQREQTPEGRAVARERQRAYRARRREQAAPERASVGATGGAACECDGGPRPVRDEFGEVVCWRCGRSLS